MRKTQLQKPKVEKSHAKKATTRLRQGGLPVRKNGGARPGAGRKPNGEKAMVSRGPRAVLAAQFPVLVTMNLLPGLPRLRSQPEYTALLSAFAAGCDRHGFRLIHYAVRGDADKADHLHLLVEARDRRALTRGMQGLSIRIAKALNRLWNRHGTVFADRYDGRICKTPREVHTALSYMLANGKKRTAAGRKVAGSPAVDAFTSAPWFDGFRKPLAAPITDAIERPVALARTWILTTGWRRHGLLSVRDLPAND